MILYSKNPELRLREELWGGICSMPGGKLILIPKKELFYFLQNFSKVEYKENSSLPEELIALLSLGIIVKEIKEQ